MSLIKHWIDAQLSLGNDVLHPDNTVTNEEIYNYSETSRSEAHHRRRGNDINAA
jgi:hypothetical protein|tara:strand:- start:1094 stop:1255 length:162 start_codon:yes stop_codon:yes gene_type:complete